MPGEFTLSKNAQFYAAPIIIDDDITLILDSASDGSTPGIAHYLNEFRVSIAHANFRYSARIFSVEREVYFHNSPDLKDSLYGYIVILEIDDHLVILKKNCDDLSDALDEKFHKLNYESFTATFDDNNVEFQKLNVRNMTVSERALRARSYEAWDLKGLLSLHAAGRSIPSFFRIKDGGATKSFNLNSGRMVEFSDRQSIEEVAIWARDMLAKMVAGAADQSFLDNFARIVELQVVLDETHPRSLLIEASVLKEKVESGALHFLFTTRAGKDVRLSSAASRHLFDLLDRVYEIDDDEHIVGHELDGWIKAGAEPRKTLTFHSKLLSKVKVEGVGVDRGTLQKYIIKNGLYAVCFENPKYMYFMKKCFLDTAGTSEIDTLLKIFEPLPAMSASKSEKGGGLVGLKEFPKDSLFSIVETMHAGDDFVFCDDLGDEWADHITFNSAEACLSFIHSKHKDQSLSASALHDVVGQAIKNLGNMHSDANRMRTKYDKKFTSKLYTKSSIARVRKRTGQFPTYLDKFLANYAVNRVAVLACSFISFQAISKELSALKSTGHAKGNIVQFYWIVSSFAHACRDAGITPKIYCKP